MKQIIVPTTDVNSDTALMVEHFVAERAVVVRGSRLCAIETSKAAIDVESDADGVVHWLVNPGSDFPLSDSVAVVFETVAELEGYLERERSSAENAANTSQVVRATKKALLLAERAGLDVASLGLNRLVTSDDVEAALRQRSTATAGLGELLTLPAGQIRALLIGGGAGATQVMEILRQKGEAAAVGILDDTAAKQGASVGGVPVVGTTAELEMVVRRGGVDGVIIAISTSVAARARYRAAANALELPLLNAIHPTAVIPTDLVMGGGNVICAFCHFGNGSTVGDNNFISAYNSFDHHNRVGSDISTGPGCMASGNVRIGDRVRLGTGIMIEPGLELGDDVQVASGAIIVGSVPAGHAVKTKVVATVVVPVRRQRA